MKHGWLVAGVAWGSTAAHAQDSCNTEPVEVEVECNLRSFTSAPPDSQGDVVYRVVYVYPGKDAAPKQSRQRVTVKVPVDLTTSVEAFLTTFPYQTCEGERTVGEGCDGLVANLSLRVPPALAEHEVGEP